ncbi:MTSS1-like protein isoform X4 [Pomacea canaliculata]|uniref:MTSS1-like protein isoform X4 n=1 Tax=Pomacea canaliculata TaxID=400727 RepID=UPI000D72DFCF|nr:MTSS1-like protein isoform X4 [Pomacea canaliculata]
MEANAEKDCSVLGNLFQTIVSDLRSSSPIWEDFTYKATKLHQSLKTTLVAIGAFLEAFQKVADMATNSKGATREIGSALTRLCMRHRNIEASLKALTSSILDSLVAPLQEKLEDWKKVVAQLDKDHAKEYKKARQEIKKAASDTMRLQKKVKKGVPHGKNEMQLKLDVAMQDVNAKYLQLEEAEKNSVRTALIEERGRFCLFISCIKPFVDHEVQLLTEVTHLQEIMHCLCMQASEPQSLPPSSEQVILDLKGMDPAAWNIQPSPPSSPSSLGSRKSSMCSINSINSSSSGSSKSHSPSHTMHKRTASQPPMGTERLTSVSSQDSGFTSQDMLFLRPTTPQSLSLYQASNSDRDSTGTDTGDCDSTPTTPSGNMVTTPTASVSSASSQPVIAPIVLKQERVRPHTISVSSEKTHTSRPALKPELFEPLPEKADQGEVDMRDQSQAHAGGKIRPHSTASSGPYARPAATINKMQPVLPPHCPRPKIKAVPPPSLPPGAQPVYANTMDLQRMVVENQARQLQRWPSDEPDGDTVAPTTPPVQQSAKPASSAPTDTDLDLSTMDLEAAIRSLDSCTAALINEVVEEDKEKETRASEEDKEEKNEEEGVETQRASRSHKMQQNSLELAAAIRELEESTAALQSTYDASNHTSHSSLQCSSGYATMNSTPSSSEDTIASGDFEFPSLAYEAEKYFTIPRSGEMSAAYRAALYPKRPASTAGVPASGANIMRRSSMNAAKPPPPVRRTASISSTSSAVLKGNTSPPTQMSESTSSTSVNDGQAEGAYAELQFIQQNIQSQRGLQKMQPPQQPQQPPPPRPKPGGLQRQQSNETYFQQNPHQTSPSPDRASNSSGSSGGSSHYAVPNVASSPSQASVIQSLNAKFASLNQQYQDSQYQQDFPNNTATYIGGNSGGGGGDPEAARMMPPPPAPSSTQAQTTQVAVQGHGLPGEGYSPGQGHNQPQRGGQHVLSHSYHQGYPGEGRGHIQGYWAQSNDRPDHSHHQGHQPLGHSPYQITPGHGHQGHGPFRGHAGHGHGHAHSHPHGHPGGVHGQQHSEVEDFPLPPTEEELAEMEEMYSRPSPVNARPTIQASLMTELKKRVSVEEASDV